MIGINELKIPFSTEQHERERRKHHRKTHYDS